MQRGLEMVPLSKAKELFESGLVLFLDSRHEYEYNAGHIRGAVNVPLNKFINGDEFLGGIPRDKTLVVYCDGSECNSSIELAIKLEESGFINVKIFFGGWKEWKSSGLPVEKK
jgi:rhodanese-related sulfurtransferase